MHNKMPVIVAVFQRLALTTILGGPMQPNANSAEGRSTPAKLPDFRFAESQNDREERGHPKLPISHAPFTVNTKARDCWIPAMETVIVECQIAGDVITVIRQFFDTAAPFPVNSPHA